MSLLRYPEYKDSGVAWLGEAPAHWSINRYKEIFAERDERSTDGSETLLSVSAYTGVSPRSAIIEDGDHLSRAESLEGYKVCYPGDLVMNIMLAWNKGLGFSSYQGIVSPAYSVFKLRSSHNSKFLDFLVRDSRTTLYFKSFSAGVIESRLRLYPDVFGSLYCALPPKNEQAAIATFLDRETAKIDALIAEQEKLLALLAEKRQAAISHAVTKGLNPNVPMKESGVEWLGEVPAHWRITRIKHLAKLITKGTTPTTIGSEFRESGVRFLKAENIFDGKVLEAPENYIDEETHNLLARSSLQADDVLVVIAGATTGKSAVLPENLLPCNTNQAIAFIRPSDNKYSSYIHRWLSSTQVQTAIELDAVQSAQPNLSMENLGNLFVLLPTNDEEFQSILKFIDSEAARLDALATEATHAVELLKERRAALISAAVTGKINVQHLADQEAA